MTFYLHGNETNHLFHVQSETINLSLQKKGEANQLFYVRSETIYLSSKKEVRLLLAFLFAHVKLIAFFCVQVLRDH